MSTSYTNTLKFGKPAAGDSGWGNVLNGEVTDMVEEAIAGMSTINTWSAATPAVHTLTESNGASSESRAAILRLTDTTSDIASVANLIVPDNTKLYCIINETGHTVTVKTASGTGIAIPTAVQNNVVCNGTNVVEQVNYQVSARANTITSDGLTVAGTFKVGTSGSTVTTIADEDNMASDSAFKLVTQQSVKSYVDNNGSFFYPMEALEWSNVNAASLGTEEPYIAVGASYGKVASFNVPGNSDTDFHVIDVGCVYEHKSSSATTNGVVFKIIKKSKVATGAVLGAITVAPAKVNGVSGNYFYQFSIAGDQRQKLGHATKIWGNNSPGAGAARPIATFTYDSGNNRTDIVFPQITPATTLTGLGIGDDVYYATDGWESVGSSTPLIQEEFTVTEFADGSFSSTETTDRVFNFPTITVKNSNTVATEFEVYAKLTGSASVINFRKAYVTAKNIRRG
jgi:hypothetical protein